MTQEKSPYLGRAIERVEDAVLQALNSPTTYRPHRERSTPPFYARPTPRLKSCRSTPVPPSANQVLPPC